MKKVLQLGIISFLSALLIWSCSTVQNANNTQKGTAIGATGGAILGAIIGNQIGSGHSEIGAVIGGVIGGGTGNVIGRKMDQQAQEIETEIPGAKVERINEGEAISVTFDGESGGVTFATAKSAITPESQANLDKLIAIFRKYPDTNLLIQGHTDDVGSESSNMELSRKRAVSVYDYMKLNGLPSERMTTKWFGESMPKVSNDTPANRQINRRVEVFITPNEKMIEESSQEQ